LAVPLEESKMKRIGRWGLIGVAIGAVPMVMILGYDIDAIEGMLVSLIFLPIAALLLPWYAAFFRENWFPVVFFYLLGGIFCVMMSFGDHVDPHDDQ
jgi:hypothetical protein